MPLRFFTISKSDRNKTDLTEIQCNCHELSDNGKGYLIFPVFVPCGLHQIINTRNSKE